MKLAKTFTENKTQELNGQNKKNNVMRNMCISSSKFKFKIALL